MAAIILNGEVSKRKMIVQKAAVDKAQLSMELLDSETKFAKFANRVPIGLAIHTSSGVAVSANNLWKELSQLDVGCQMADWLAILVPEEVDYVIEAWDRVTAERKAVTIQTILKKPWKAPDLDADGKVCWTNTHLLISLYPDLDENGNVSSVMSCVTDISELK